MVMPNLDEEIKPVQRGAHKPGAGEAPPGQEARPSSDIVRVQQFLINEHLSIKGKDKPNQKSPDGGWGPISNSSLHTFIAQVEGENKPLAASLRNLAKSDPKETAANMAQIAKLLAPPSGAEKSPSATPAHAGQRPEEADVGPTTFTVVVPATEGRAAKEFKNIPMYESIMKSPANLESVFQHYGLIDAGTHGAARAAQIMAAAQGFRENPIISARMPTTSALIDRTARALADKYTAAGQPEHYADYIKKHYAERFNLLKPNAQSTALSHIESMLERANQLDDAGNLKNKAAVASGRNQEIINLLDRLAKNARPGVV